MLSLASVTTERFQSTLPHGERLGELFRLVRRELISIHAPAWGATDVTNVQTTDGVFQSTLPHGERLGELLCLFNGIVAG